MSEHTCAEHMHWQLNLQHFGNTNLKYLEVTGACKECGAKAHFRGPPGVNPGHPTVTLDGAEATFPFLFVGETYDGKGTALTITHSGGH